MKIFVSKIVRPFKNHYGKSQVKKNIYRNIYLVVYIYSEEPNINLYDRLYKIF